MSESKADVPIQMTRSKRTFFLYAIMILYAGFAASGYGAGVVMPRKLAAMDAMGFYSLASALGTLGMMLALPLVGKLCDLFGTKRVAMFGVFLQLITRIALVYTLQLPLFLVLYTLSNIGCGFYISAPFAMIADTVEAAERPKYYGMLITFKALGSLIGPLMTGQLMDSGYVDLAFASYLPFMILSVPFILAFYPNKKTSRTTGAKFDFAGVILLVVSICCIIFWLTLGGSAFSWLSPTSMVLLAVGALTLVALIRVENKHPNPSVAIHMFKKKRFTAAFLSGALVAAFSTTLSAYVIVYTQQIMQVSSVLSSTVTMPMTIAQAVFGVVLGRYLGKKFTERFRPAALFSLFLVALALFVLSTIQPTSPMMVIYFVSTLGGIGTVIPQSAYASFFQTELRPEEYGAAQGMFSFGSTGGSCIFMALTGAVLNAGGSLNHTFMVAAGFGVVSLIIGFVGFRFKKEEPVAA